MGKAQWISFFQNLTDDQIVWRAPWLAQVPILYRCGDYPWVILLLGLWGGISYAPAMLRRQLGLGSLEFIIPMTHGLRKWEFTFGDPKTADIVRMVIDFWKETQRIKTSRYTKQTTPASMASHSW
ncbi:hypothetical protein HN51_035478 [Arachis hypogaea]